MDPDAPLEPQETQGSEVPTQPGPERPRLQHNEQPREGPGAGPPGPPSGGWRESFSRHRLLWLIVGLWALAAITLWRIGSERQRAADNAAASHQARARITVGHTRSGDINVYVTALGTVTPTYTVAVYPQVTGRVNAVHYREGQMVQKGEALIDIDARPYQAMLDQAEGTLARDRALLAQARLDLQRYQAASARNAIPRQQLEDQAHAVRQYEGAVKSDEGAVAYDRVQLEYCHIVAPISGRVGLRLIDPGNTVFAGSGSILVVITQLQPITVVFNVSEDDLPQVQDELHAGQTLRVDAFDRADERLLSTGHLTSLDNQIDTTTGTLRLRAEFPNEALRLFPNQFVNARLLVRTLRGATLVPTAAMQFNGAEAFVYRVNPDNTVTVQPVKTVTSSDTETAVEGLGPDVPVATSGFDRLENGVPVQIRQASAASASTGSPRASQRIHPGVNQPAEPSRR